MSRTGTVHAGCRAFPDMVAARDHWKWRDGTALGAETTRILDWMTAEYAARIEKES